MPGKELTSPLGAEIVVKLKLDGVTADVATSVSILKISQQEKSENKTGILRIWRPLTAAQRQH